MGVSCSTLPREQSDCQSSTNFCEAVEVMGLALDLEWSKLSRCQKAIRFRAKRRQTNIKLFGAPIARRSGAKNCNRQVAALARQRDDNGKFLWGPRKQRQPYQPAHNSVIFKITKVVRG